MRLPSDAANSGSSVATGVDQESATGLTDDIGSVVAELQCAVLNYEWGDCRFIPALLGHGNASCSPCAELWMGTHPDAPSKAILKGGTVSLDRLIDASPAQILHESVATSFGGKLPFLFKVLAAATPLSLQVHPTKRQAEAGFASENAAGVPLGAPHRNYRDENHKPELIVALTDFYGLRGFRPLPEIRQALEGVPELREFAEDFESGHESLQSLYSRLMCLPQESVDSVLVPLVRRLQERHQTQPFTKSDREYWLLQAMHVHSRAGHHDRGLLSFFLLNLVHLRPGEGMYLPAGVLHAYLEGAGVELMANSNNVLRGGLTAKHVDVVELLRNVTFDGGAAEIIHGQRLEDTSQWVYRTPAREFELHRLELNRHRPHLNPGDHAVEILIVVSAPQGLVTMKTAHGSQAIGCGQVFLVAANTPYELHAGGPATLFRATVPVAQASVTTTIAPGGIPGFRGRRPETLAFGTSGLRGLVTDITDLEAYINTRGFLDHALAAGQAMPGQVVCVASDLRPSSDGPDRSILRAVARAIGDAGLFVENLGRLPTPALAYHAMQQCCPSIMVTGSHIPFDRNGIKFSQSAGEVLKSDEASILRAIDQVRQQEYSKAPDESLFADDGMFDPGQSRPLPPVNDHARRSYLRRYLDFLPENALGGLRVVFYQHSAVARDLLVELLISLGAEVIPMGRSETFVPVDTEAISQDRLELLQRFADEAQAQHGSVDAVVSTDGDSDRPLIAGITPEGDVRFFGGDIVGIVVADFLEADAVVVPISANDAVDQWAISRGLTVRKTRIGSPHVIEAMQEEAARGARRVVGWEANGGFLTGTDITRGNRVLKALPTRDAALPLLAVLHSAKARGVSLVELFAQLPRRFSSAGLLDKFPPETSRALIRSFSPPDAAVHEVEFAGTSVRLHRADGKMAVASNDTAPMYETMRQKLERFFSREDGFGRVTRLNTLDGLRVWFDNGDITHVRPSGNAPQLRIYAVASDPGRAGQIVALALREPEGILRRMAANVTGATAEAVWLSCIRRNIALNDRLLAVGETPELIGTVCGSETARQFWQSKLDGARGLFQAESAISFLEDLPTNQAFGLLLLWQRLKPHIHTDRGSLVAFVFGDGTRSTPFTETDNAQKPAMATFAPTGNGSVRRFLTMVELAMKHFVPVQQHLRRSGFRGLVVKWGDEVQIPVLDLSGKTDLYRDADIVRFVSMREINADEALNKDWVGVDETGRVTAFIPRRPIEQMELLADRGLVQRRNGRLHGGVNLGSIAVSYALLDPLLDEFHGEVNDPTADRRNRPTLDPEFFTALTVAVIEDPVARSEAWAQAVKESPEMAHLACCFPNIIYRLRSVIRSFRRREGRDVKVVAMDFIDQYWGDIGQHAKIGEFYLALNRPGADGAIARALAGLTGERDTSANLIVNSSINPNIRVRNSVLIDVELTGSGEVEDSVLIGTRAGNVAIRGGFDVLSTVVDLGLEAGGGTYKIVSGVPVRAAPGERLTTLFLPSLGAQIFRVMEDTDLKDKAKTYVVPILGNPLSFQQAHAEMGALGVDTLERCRGAAEAAVLATIRDQL